MVRSGPVQLLPGGQVLAEGPLEDQPAARFQRCAPAADLGKDLLPVHAPDRERDSIWYVGAATGLPWATALGRYAADRLVTGRRDFDATFSPERDFVVGPRLQALLSRPVSFALSNAVARLR